MRRAVVKLGGSTAFDDSFDRWIEAIAGSELPLVVTPGGGPFADNVRQNQARMGFSDAAAHRMAILAMEQFGHVILDRDDRFEPARSMSDIDRALQAGKIPVWLPSEMTEAAADIPVSWQVTSDSLAAWLCGRIGAEALLLVKQSRDFSESDDIASLTARGIVDPRLGSMLPPGVDFHIAGVEDAAALGAGRLPGISVPREKMPARKTG